MALLLLLLACDPDGGRERGAKDADTAVDTTDTSRPEDTGEGEETGDTGETATPPDTGPYDADGDGFTPGGGDCDDGDARIYPGAPDACDAVDQDCDGEAQPPGSCGDVVPLEDGAVGWWEGAAAYGTLRIGEADTDYTGDGLVDVLAWVRCTEEGDGTCPENVALLPGRVPAPGTAWSDEGAPWWEADPSRDWISDFGDAGDFDGDGSTDLFVASNGCYPSSGAVYVMLGPSVRWSASGGAPADAGDGSWVQATYDDCFAQAVSGGHDVDGDGLDDLLVVTSGNPDDGEGRALSLVRGRTGNLPSGALVTEETWFEDDLSLASFAALPDMDGDGVGEAAVVDSPVPYELLFLAVTEASGAPLSASVDRLATEERLGLGLFPGRSDVGDVDRDGYADVALDLAQDPGGDGTYDFCFTTLRGATDLRQGSVEDHLGGRACFDGGDFVYRADEQRLAGDADGDGIADVLYGEGYGSSCLVPSSRVPSTGVVTMDEVRPYCFGIGDGEGTDGGVADLDGDGLPEILGSQPDWDDDLHGHAGRILVAAGFEIPWGDATRW